MQEDIEELETTAHVTAAHSSAFTPQRIIPNLPPNHSEIGPGTYKQNLKITPDQTQTGPL